MTAFTQDNDLDSLLKASIKDAPALNEKVSISVSNTSIQEFMRGVANSSGLNIDVDPSMDIRIVNNFSNVRVLDMLVFLAEEYELEIDVIGNIVTVSKDPVEEKTTSACGLSRKPQPDYH
jgi:type IV pilus assembly protein PilQ